MAIETKFKQMSKEVALNKHFSIKVEEKKNRLLLDLRGFWPSKVFYEYVEAVTVAMQYLNGGFTVLSNMYDFQPLPQNLLAQKNSLYVKLLTQGMERMAEVKSKNLITDMQMDLLASRNTLNRRQFVSKDLAIAWLNDLPVDQPIKEKPRSIERGAKGLLGSSKRDSDGDYMVF